MGWSVGDGRCSWLRQLDVLDRGASAQNRRRFSGRSEVTNEPSTNGSSGLAAVRVIRS